LFVFVCVCVCVCSCLCVLFICRFVVCLCWPAILNVEYAKRRIKCDILFIFSLFHEYIPLEYVRVRVIYRVYQAEYGIRFLAAVSQQNVKTDSTPRPAILFSGQRSVKCLWEVFVLGSCRARVCAGVGGVFSVGVSCVRVTCWLFYRSKISRPHAHAHDSRTNHSHQHRASNGATTLNSISRRRRPQAAAQRCACALEPAAH